VIQPVHDISVPEKSSPEIDIDIGQTGGIHDGFNVVGVICENDFTAPVRWIVTTATEGIYDGWGRVSAIGFSGDDADICLGVMGHRMPEQDTQCRKIEKTVKHDHRGRYEGDFQFCIDSFYMIPATYSARSRVESKMEGGGSLNLEYLE
jgi:hypothetical protein